MLEVIYYVAASLDGFIATETGGLDWLKPFESSGEDYGYGAFYRTIDSVIVGRTTFEQSLDFAEWPYPDKPVWVLSSRPLATARDEVTVTADAPVAVVDDLARRGLRRAWLVGGGSLAGSFQRAGLITEYIVSVMPALLGCGIPLLGAAGSLNAAAQLRLLGTTTYPDGVCQLRYATR